MADNNNYMGNRHVDNLYIPKTMYLILTIPTLPKTNKSHLKMVGWKTSLGTQVWMMKLNVWKLRWSGFYGASGFEFSQEIWWKIIPFCRT